MIPWWAGLGGMAIAFVWGFVEGSIFQAKRERTRR